MLQNHFVSREGRLGRRVWNKEATSQAQANVKSLASDKCTFACVQKPTIIWGVGEGLHSHEQYGLSYVFASLQKILKAEIRVVDDTKIGKYHLRDP